MEIAPDGRIFVTEQGGRLRVIENNTLLSQPFVTLNVNSAGERGLLGVAFDPNFATNDFVYVYYTTAGSPVRNRVSRFTANGDQAVAGSEAVIINLNNLSSATNHNGGAIHFGEDDKLYVAVGENANPSHSQTLGNLLGKILRINADGTIPEDNPFFNTASGANRAIWALGLRNPFTFAVQPGTGRIFVNDVGQNAFEEINEGLRGSNYGWPNSEGFRESGDPATVIGTYRDPLFQYGHSIGPTGGCAIAGGAFYNPATAQFPAEYTGDYFFADLCSGWIRRYDPATGAVTGFASGLASPVDLKVDAAGNLYYLTRGFGSKTGQVTRVQFTQTAPQIVQQPADRRVAAGQPATFAVGATGATPLTFQWQRNGNDIPGATLASFTLPATSLQDDGSTFRVVITNSIGVATSDDANLTVVDNELPEAEITVPAFGSFYNAGDVLTFAGTGTDREDGLLPPSAFRWEIVFHHASHTHPFVQPFSGVTGGSRLIPVLGETATDVFYRIHLTVTDSFGFAHSTFRDVTPRTSMITVTTNPPGIAATLDDISIATPATTSSVVGMTRTIGVPSTTVFNGVHYEFVSWSDAGAARHGIATPASDTTFTAQFRVIPAPRVADVRVVRESKRSRHIVISFDESLDDVSAVDLRNYRLAAAGPDGLFNTAAQPSNDDVPIEIDSAQVDDVADPINGGLSSRVTLIVRRGMTTGEFFQLTVDGTVASIGDPAVRGENGDVLDGEFSSWFVSGNGTPGGDFVALLGFGGSFTYLDASGDEVSLKLKKQGDLEIIRTAPAADGLRSEGVSLHLTQTGRRSRLSGNVRGGATTFQQLTGLSGVANNIQGNPSFIVDQISAVVVDRIIAELIAKM
jgi:glucose/arabinose dehydrogenase